MTRRRSSDAALPRLPLEFAYPLKVRRRGMEDAAILDELPRECALIVLKTLRLVHAWSEGPDMAGALLRRKELESFEREIVAASLDEGLWEPLVAIVAELRRPAEAKTGALGLGCFVVSEWALGVGAESTALLFAEAAALAWPEHARYAWMVGRMLRNHGRFREAELWLRRAARVAVWWEDWETQNLALNSLGNLHIQQGAFGEALQYLTKALRLARRQKMKRREAAVTHDLYMVSLYSGDYARAEKLAVAAFKLYGSDHPDLPKLAHDVTLLWARQGRFGVVLPVLKALLPFFRLPDERLKVLTATARAAGACSDPALYNEVSREAWQVVENSTAAVQAAIPAAFVDLGFGAASLSEWTKAGKAFHFALEVARERRAHDNAAQAESGLEMVQRYERMDYIAHTSSSGAASLLANAFVRSLEAANTAHDSLAEPICGRAT